MKQTKRHYHRYQRGFTLIELLVVIAILGVIAAIAIPAVSGLIDAGHEEAARVEQSTVRTAVVAAMAEVGAGELIPGHIDGDPVSCTVFYGNGSTVLPVGKYITGGLGELEYEYDVGADGFVVATTGPLA